MTNQTEVKQIVVKRLSSAHRPVTSDDPPLNIFGSDDEIAPEWDAFLGALGCPGAQARIHKLFERGFHVDLLGEA
jgi:hypothetical protein